MKKRDNPPSHQFTVGMWVRLPGMRRPGELVELFSDGTARVAFATITIRCPLSKLSSAKEPRGHTTAPPAPPPRMRDSTPSIDLHGLSSTDAIHRVEAFLNRASLDGCSQIEIIHGLGGDTLRRAVHRFLAQIPVVQRYALKLGNPGVTIVYL